MSHIDRQFDKVQTIYIFMPKVCFEHQGNSLQFCGILRHEMEIIHSLLECMSTCLETVQQNLEFSLIKTIDMYNVSCIRVR